MGRLRKNVNYEEKLFSDKNFFVENPQLYYGKWNKEIFKNNNSIQIEIGCGKGKFIIENAIRNPNINFIAIDKFATILYKVLKKLNNNELCKNIKIVCYPAEKLNEIFSTNEIDKIFLNFSDPWPKKHHEKNRLTNIRFLKTYFLFLKKDGLIEFKTDNKKLYDYTLDVIEENKLTILYNSEDIYNDFVNIIYNIQTEYEIKWLAKNVKITKIIFKQ